MKKVFHVILIILICCCSLFCGCVPACGGVGWFTGSKKVRGQVDGLAEYLASPENYYIFVTEYGEDGSASFKAMYLYTDSGVCYYELNSKTGGAAHYQGGVLKNYYDGKETVTEGGKTFAEEWGKQLTEVIRGELLKPVQDNQKGYHYMLFNYDKVFYVNDTQVNFNGVEFTGFVVNFLAHTDAPKYRNYELKLINSTLTYELNDNVSNTTPEQLAQRYEYFKQHGEW